MRGEREKEREGEGGREKGVCTDASHSPVVVKCVVCEREKGGGVREEGREGERESCCKMSV